MDPSLRPPVLRHRKRRRTTDTERKRKRKTYARSVARRLPFPDKGSSSIMVTAQTWRRKAPARLSSIAVIELRPGEKKRLKSEPWWLWSTSNMLEAVTVVVTSYNETIIGGRRPDGVSTSFVDEAKSAKNAIQSPNRSAKTASNRFYQRMSPCSLVGEPVDPRPTD